MVEVADDGPGIPPRLREQIFDRFVRGDGPADTAGGPGSGLGLAIVRAVATSHGGTVEVAESAAGGALFRVRLPLATEPSSPPEPFSFALADPTLDLSADETQGPAGTLPNISGRSFFLRAGERPANG